MQASDDITRCVISCKKTRKNSDIVELKLFWPMEKIIKPGQFVMLEPIRCMPRPFSVARQGHEYIDLYIKAIGENTRYYSHLGKFDVIDVLGPYGKPLDLDFPESNVLLIAGGSGFAGLMMAAKQLRKNHKKVRMLYGGRHEFELVSDKHFLDLDCDLSRITEFGSGSCGLVTDLLKKHIEEYNTRIIACGPKPMLECVAEMAKKHNIPCTVLLEEVMACGIGSCKGCTIFGKDGDVKKVCSDGPAFDATWVDWEKLVPPRIEVISQQKQKPSQEPSMKVELKGQDGRNLFLSSPIMTSSGCFEYDNQEKGKIDLTHIGAIVEKGLTLEPRAGNPSPRICEVKTGMLNSIGLENIGTRRFVKEKLPILKAAGFKVIVNFSGFTIEEILEGAILLDDSDVDAIELNVSCPNVKKANEIFGMSPRATAEAVATMRKYARNKILITKLTPMAQDSISIARAAIEAGSDILSMINTILGMSIDIHTRKPKIAMRYGGYSGHGIKPIGVRIVDQIYRELKVPIIGMGGIENYEDAIEYMLAGANAIAIGTGAFKNHNIFTEIYTGIEEYLKKYSYGSVQDIVGNISIV